MQALGREEEAAQVTGQIAAMIPENDREAMITAIASFKAGGYDTAAAVFQVLYDKGTLEAAEAAEAGYYLGQISFIQKDYKTAYDYLSKWEGFLLQTADSNSFNLVGWADQAGNFAELYYQIAFCAMESEQLESAEEYYQKLEGLQEVSCQKKQEKLYIVLLERQGKWQEALKQMEHYMENYVNKENASEYEQAKKEYDFLKSR